MGALLAIIESAGFVYLLVGGMLVLTLLYKDPVLPAWSGFLKVIKNVAVNSQRDKLLGIRE